MHYFKFNIGDYHKKAGRLTMLEHGAYTLLLHACYDREKFPTKAEAIDWCWARSVDEIAAVEFVLSKFFRLDGEVYVQDRIQEEIDAFHAKSEKNKHIALEREAARRTKRARVVNEASPQEHESPPNHKPRTKNHKPPVPDGTVTPAAEVEGLDQQAWTRWVEYRKGIGKAIKPASMAAAMKALAAHGDDQAAVVEQSVANGWQGLFALKAAQSMGLHRQSAHTGFGKVNYREGIDDDGFFA